MDLDMKISRFLKDYGRKEQLLIKEAVFLCMEERLNSSTIINNIIKMGGTCSQNASNSEIASAVLTIPQKITTNNLTGTIEYQYHHCSDSCYRLCGASNWQQNGQVWENGGATGEFHWYCGTCGRSTGNSRETPSYSCTNKIKKCGYSDGQIIGAIIKY